MFEELTRCFSAKAISCLTLLVFQFNLSDVDTSKKIQHFLSTCQYILIQMPAFSHRKQFVRYFFFLARTKKLPYHIFHRFDITCELTYLYSRLINETKPRAAFTQPQINVYQCLHYRTISPRAHNFSICLQLNSSTKNNRCCSQLFPNGKSSTLFVPND